MHRHLYINRKKIDDFGYREMYSVHLGSTWEIKIDAVAYVIMTELE